MADDLIRLRVTDVKVAVPAGNGVEAGVVVLEEDDEPHRSLRIYIGQHEARAIHVSWSNAVPPRPSTWDLFVSTIALLDARLDRIIISDVEELRHFYAELLLYRTGSDDALIVPARPSDALALGLRAYGCALYAQYHVLDAAGTLADGSHWVRPTVSAAEPELNGANPSGEREGSELRADEPAEPEGTGSENGNVPAVAADAGPTGDVMLAPTAVVTERSDSKKAKGADGKKVAGKKKKGAGKKSETKKPEGKRTDKKSKHKGGKTNAAGESGDDIVRHPDAEPDPQLVPREPRWPAEDAAPGPDDAAPSSDGLPSHEPPLDGPPLDGPPLDGPPLDGPPPRDDTAPDVEATPRDEAAPPDVEAGGPSVPEGGTDENPLAHGL